MRGRNTPGQHLTVAGRMHRMMPPLDSSIDQNACRPRTVEREMSSWVFQMCSRRSCIPVTGVLSTLLPDHALNAFRTLFPHGKVRTLCCIVAIRTPAAPPLIPAVCLRVTVATIASIWLPVSSLTEALSRPLQFGAEFNAWVTKLGAYSVIACPQQTLLSESPAAMLSVCIGCTLICRAYQTCAASTLQKDAPVQVSPGWWAPWKLRRSMSCSR